MPQRCESAMYDGCSVKTGHGDSPDDIAGTSGHLAHSLRLRPPWMPLLS
jgi:hypothetical protein